MGLKGVGGESCVMGPVSVWKGKNVHHRKVVLPTAQHHERTQGTEVYTEMWLKCSMYCVHFSTV